MNFTTQETEWLKRTKRERFQISVPQDMNTRALSYVGTEMLPKYKIQSRVMTDFHGYFDESKIVAVENWDGKSDAFTEATA